MSNIKRLLILTFPVSTILYNSHKTDPVNSIFAISYDVVIPIGSYQTNKCMSALTTKLSLV